MAPFELYAFEFHVQRLKTNKELKDVTLEVKLFQAAPLILKTRRPYCRDDPPTLKKITCSDESLGAVQDRDDNLGPFTLDMESFTADLKEKDGSEDSSAQSDQNVIISKPPVKKIKRGENEVSSKGMGISDSANVNISEGGSDGRLAVDGLKSKTSLDNHANGKFKQSLRMFPKDPTGQPYHKVKKGEQAAQEEVGPDRYSKITTNQEEEHVEAHPTPPSKKEEPAVQEDQVSIEGSEAKPSDVCEVEKIITDIAEDFPAETVNTETVRNTFEAGLTMVLGMPAFTMLHNLQRSPLQVKVCSTSCELTATGYLDLSPLSEAVLRAERGPPTPVISSTEVLLTAYGDFVADLCCSIKLFAFGSKIITQMKLPRDPNLKMNCERAQEVPKFKAYNMDIQDLPPVISCPEQISLRHAKSSHIKEIVEEYPKEKGNERFFVEEDIVFCPNNRLIAPRPSDNYETMKWKIDQMLGLATVKEEEQNQTEEQYSKKQGLEEEDRIQKLNDWHKQKKIKMDAQETELMKKRRETRSILKKILQGMNEPDPIGPLKEAQTLAQVDNENEDEEKDTDVLGDPKRLYEEIRRQQREEKMIKHYKRLFRKMLRHLGKERRFSPDVLRRKEKRGKMKDLLEELETFGADEVEKAYIEVMKFRKVGEKKAWDLDSWPDIPEEYEAEELDGGDEDGQQMSMKSN